MRLIAFPQWDKLTSLLRGMARQSAADYAQRNIVRIIPKNGIAHLANYAANLLAVEGGTTTLIMPDIVPGKARDFMLRVRTKGPLWWSGEWWSSLPIRDLPTPLRRDPVLLPRRMRIRLANLCNVARLAHRRKVLRREVVRTGKSEHVANLDRPPWPFGENRKNVVRHPPASALR